MAIGMIATFTGARRMHRRPIPVGIVRSILGTGEERLGNNITTMACTTTRRCHNMGLMATVHMGEDIRSSGTCQRGETLASRTRRCSRNKGALGSPRISSRYGPAQRFSLLVRLASIKGRIAIRRAVDHLVGRKRKPIVNDAVRDRRLLECIGYVGKGDGFPLRVSIFIYLGRLHSGRRGGNGADHIGIGVGRSLLVLSRGLTCLLPDVDGWFIQWSPP